MKQNIIKTAGAALVATAFLSTASWAERPDEVPACEFPGGAFYKEANVLYLESYNIDTAKVVISNETVNCVSEVSQGNYKVVVERSSALASNSTIVLPINFQLQNNECIKLYEIVDFTTNDNGNWFAKAKNTMSSGNANRPMLVITDVENEACSDIKELELTASGNPQSTEHSVAEFWLHNSKTSSEDWAFTGTYAYTSWDSSSADFGKIYGYAAEKKGTFSAGQFVKVGSKAYMPPLRAFLKYRGSSALAKTKANAITLPESISVELIDGDGETTGFAKWNPRTNVIKMDNRWFDLKGRNLNSKPESKGFFINKTSVK